MRIACLHLPGFPVQVAVRATHRLQGTAFAVVGAGRVVGASRRAAEAGVAVGMTAAQARAAAVELTLVPAGAPAAEEAMRALGEAALALSMTVDAETPGALYALVPPRAAGFGEKLLRLATRMGFVGRVGVADNRFTAWAATQATPHARTRVVPAGGSAAFLAPLPLTLLPLDPDVRRMLGHLGVTTIGDFAALPSPSVGRGGRAGALALARGVDATPLEALVPAGTVRESLSLDAPIGDAEALAFVLRPLADRVAARLEGRGAGAARLRLRLGGEELIVATEPTRSARAILDAVRAGLRPRSPVAEVGIEVLEEGEVEPAERELFEPRGGIIGS
jgi:protein ImuB